MLKPFVNKQILGDSYEVLKNIPDECIDVIITSPPYNVDVVYDTYNDKNDWDKYFEFLFNILYECNRVLINGGRLIINISPANKEYVPTHHIISEKLRSIDMIWRNEIIWNKNTFNGPLTAWGSFKSPSCPYIKNKHEFIEVFSKGTIKKIGDKENIDLTVDEFKKWVINPWDITPETQMNKKYGHPAMFPEHLVERLIKLFSYKNDIILDPFNGIGTTCVVAYNLGRRYIGIDISEKYHSISIDRMKKAESEKMFFG
jgi:DNA modification methylase